jgi:hypothetical protein
VIDASIVHEQELATEGKRVENAAQLSMEPVQAISLVVCRDDVGYERCVI